MAIPTPTSISNRPASPSDGSDDGGSGPAATGRSRRRRLTLVMAGCLVGLVVVAVAVWSWGIRQPSRDPVVRFTQPVPSDVEAEARAAVARFVEVFEGRRGCIGTAEVVLVDRVEGGDARYDVDAGVVEIEIPTTPARFRESLVHELAHHVEASCPAFADLQHEWLVATGAEAWSGQASWEDRPSEQWAETVVGLVLGERLLHGDEMTLDPMTTELVTDWLR